MMPPSQQSQAWPPPDHGRLDLVARKPFIDIPKFASARNSERSRACASNGHST
jgi:hypothetical protein